MSALVSRAAAAMWVLSFVMSANGNVLPQLYFQRNAPAQKLTWLALSLLCATTASLAGVLASRGRSVGARGTISAMVVALSVEALLPRAPSPIAFVAMAAIAQFSVNFALNALDHAAIERAGAQRAAHDRASTAARLLGMLLAPLVVPALIDRGPALSALVAVAGVAAVGFAIGVVTGAREAREAARAVASDGAMSAEDRRVLGFALAVYVALYLIAANLIYLLRDVARVDHAERVGGATLTVVFFGALLGAGLRTKVLSPAKSRPNVRHLLAPLPWMALVAAALSSGWRVPVAALGAGGLALGLSYGVFLGALREHVSHGAGEEKRGALLSAFNNLANVSSLVAFALLAIAATATAGRAASAYPFVMAAAGALPFAGALLLARRAR